MSGSIVKRRGPSGSFPRTRPDPTPFAFLLMFFSHAFVLTTNNNNNDTACCVTAPVSDDTEVSRSLFIHILCQKRLGHLIKYFLLVSDVRATILVGDVVGAVPVSEFSDKTEFGVFFFIEAILTPNCKRSIRSPAP